MSAQCLPSHPPALPVVYTFLSLCAEEREPVKGRKNEREEVGKGNRKGGGEEGTDRR